MLFPRDTKAGGTWIAASADNRVVCLLNGAYEKHHHDPPYAKSRGIMLLEFVNYKSAPRLCHDYEFKGMEPFTMIIAEQHKLREIRWDGINKHFKECAPNEAHIWSSATLYPAIIQEKRERWFAQWLINRRKFTTQAVLDFHRNAGDGDPENDLIMNRSNVVQTVSITSILKGPQQIEMQYHDLIHSKLKKAEIKLEREILESHQP